MSTTKMGAVMLIQAGDAEISGALASGAMAGRAQRLNERERGIVEAEIDRQAIERDTGTDWSAAARGVKIAIGRNLGADDYAMMRFEADVAYGEPVDYPTPMERVGAWLLKGYALAVYLIAAAYHAQDGLLGGRA